MTSTDKESITPFEPRISQDEVDRLWRKLKDTRLPTEPIIPDAGIDMGPPISWCHKLLSYWANTYNWSAAQEKIFSWPHFTTTIEFQTIHFIHKRASSSSSSARKQKPIPLLMVHGWPGSFYEFSRTIDSLTNGTSSPSSGSDDEPVFDVVVPSLPGFCWSQGNLRDWTLQDTARIFDKLMRNLGYKTYTAHGGDWGHWVVRELGAKYSTTCTAVHTNMCPSVPPVGNTDTREGWTEREQIAQNMTDEFLGKPGKEGRMSYAIQMRTRPQTIGMALSDSPQGIMMWVGEKYREIVDPLYRDLNDKDPQVKQFMDDLCTTLCLYFFTPRTIMTSTMCYYNNVRHEDYVEFNTKPENLIKAPFGFSSFRWDISPVTERCAATTGNCRWFRQFDHGGHFAALEVPDELVADLRDCFKQLWKPED